MSVHFSFLSIIPSSISELRRLQNVLNCVHHPQHSPGTLLSFFAGILLQNHKGYDESMYVVAFEVSDTLFTQNLSSVSSSFWAAEFRHIWYCFLVVLKITCGIIVGKCLWPWPWSVLFSKGATFSNNGLQPRSHIWISKAHEISFSVISNNEIVGGMGFFGASSWRFSLALLFGRK